MEAQKEKDKIVTFEKQLAPFLKQNSYSKIEKKGKSYYVTRPWNDESVSFILKDDSQSDLIAVLNNLILPPRFTALYHLDSNTMEYIYTLLDKNDPYISRQFEFTVDGKTYYCQFKDASERLLLLSKLFRPVGEEPRTECRNLSLLNIYMNPKLMQLLKLDEDFFTKRKPISFFVNGFERYEEDKIVEISKHLNFFISYYDRKSPLIIIHSTKSDEPQPLKVLQFVEKDFPKKISTSYKDSFLLDLALAANEVETRLKFLYYYQILEYAAFYYVDSDIKRRMLKIIATPDIQAKPEKYISSILDTITDIRQSDEARLNKIVETRCSPDIVWKELQQNLTYFSKRQEFEGGFVIEPFVSEDMTLEGFATMWIPKTPDTLRKIRNALVHGRESRLGLFIAPTRANEFKYRPWIPIVRRIAEQVIIFGGLT